MTNFVMVKIKLVGIYLNIMSTKFGDNWMYVQRVIWYKLSISAAEFLNPTNLPVSYSNFRSFMDPINCEKYY